MPPEKTQAVGSTKSTGLLCKAHEAAGRAIVSIDESGFANDMPRTHGYAAKGKRCLGSHAWGTSSRSNVIGALPAGVLPRTLLCDFNSERSLPAWIADEFIANLPPASVRVMDNAPFQSRLRGTFWNTFRPTVPISIRMGAGKGDQEKNRESNKRNLQKDILNRKIMLRLCHKQSP